MPSNDPKTRELERFRYAINHFASRPHAPNGPLDANLRTVFTDSSAIHYHSLLSPAASYEGLSLRSTPSNHPAFHNIFGRLATKALVLAILDDFLEPEDQLESYRYDQDNPTPAHLDYLASRWDAVFAGEHQIAADLYQRAKKYFLGFHSTSK